MKYMTTKEIRKEYLDYFMAKGCKLVPSSSLIPDDPSLLLTSAGMVQFKAYFLQQKQLEQPFIGATSAQKCVRTNDIDIIGTTGRHLSFFEMLGNFSFGDYFKEEMCSWALDFSINHLELPKEKIYFTVFEDDDETIEIWKNLGIEESHISRLGEEDNFWRAGPTGPCGPCSELYFDMGEDVGCKSPTCAPGCDCDRFLEYWNCVFTQYNGTEDGRLEPLPKKNIDTGMGLERIASILQGVKSNYEIDLMRSLIALGESLSGKTYGSNPDWDLSLRIMADHSRSITFMICDGILPSNEGRGYVLRRLLRRAVLKAAQIGIHGPFLGKFTQELIVQMGQAYPQIEENLDLTLRVIQSEEERFASTLRQGQAYLEQSLKQVQNNVLSGSAAFALHDTYGFPIEVTQEIAAEKGISVDIQEFDQCMQQQKVRARSSSKDSQKAWEGYGGIMVELSEQFNKQGIATSKFVGYDQDQAQATVMAIVQNDKQVDCVEQGAQAQLILDVTPFYAEKGGQIGDTGTISLADFSATVLDTKEPQAGLIAHKIVVDSGKISLGDVVLAKIDVNRRQLIARNHSATHILHWALRQVLGTHVKQAGSLVTNTRLRFDFTHFQALTSQQIIEIENLANKIIMENHVVSACEKPIAQAREQGVMALFGEKYGQIVRVLDIESIGAELCGGTHVSHTGQIGFIKIVAESSVGASLRRIEAVSSFEALAYMNQMELQLKQAANTLKVSPALVAEKVQANLELIKSLQDKQRQLDKQASEGEVDSLLEKVVDAGYPLLIANVGNTDVAGLRNTWDIVKNKLDNKGACVLAANNNGSAILLAASCANAIENGFNAGNVIKAISGAIKGGGGGKPEMAQAGGKDVQGISKALDLAKEMLLA